MTDAKWLTTEQAAALMGLTVRTVRNIFTAESKRHAAGQPTRFDIIKEGRGWLVSEASALAYKTRQYGRKKGSGRVVCPACGQSIKECVEHEK